MNQLRIQLERQPPLYKPGETLRGKADWHIDAPQQLQIRLCWFVGGGAIPESRVVEKTNVQAVSLNDCRPFSFRLPAAPYSFFGSLAMLGWAVELVGLAANQSARATFQLAPKFTPP